MEILLLRMCESMFRFADMNSLITLKIDSVDSFVGLKQENTALKLYFIASDKHRYPPDTFMEGITLS